MTPEQRQHLLPSGLLVAALVTGGISWTLEGTALWVMMAVSLALLIAGIVVVSRLESTRRKK